MSVKAVQRWLGRNWDWTGALVLCHLCGFFDFVGGVRPVEIVQRIGSSELSRINCWSTSQVVSVVWSGVPWDPRCTYETNQLRDYQRKENPFEPSW